jgi:hypothetical protein
MNRASPKTRHLAKRLIVCETQSTKTSGTRHPTAFEVCEKLRPQLATLMGNGGFRAILMRALALASAEIPWLSGVQVKADGSLESLKEHQPQPGSEEFLEGRIVLVARLLGLLGAFIGENLTLRVVIEVWPKLPFDDLEYGKGGKNEKTK